MSSSHLVSEAVEAMDAALDKVGHVEFLFLSPDDKAAHLRALARLEARVAAARLRMLATSDDVAEMTGARDVADWSVHATRADRTDARAEQRLARSMETHVHLASAHASGEVSTKQAHVISRALADLPAGTDGVDAETRAHAEQTLIEYAATFPPEQLRTLGRRILDIVAPDVGEEHERRLLEADEQRARAQTRLTTRHHGDGTSTITIRMPDSSADRLTTYLHAFTNPRRADESTAATDVTSELPYPIRLGHAFCDLLELIDPARLPIHGGSATTVMVTMDLQTLLDGTGVATTGTDGRITAGEARRLACTAGIIPTVLGGKSEILDLGRSRRLFSSAQRKALSVRDRRCRAEHCDIPADWCEAHHVTPWSHGGNTDLGDGVLVCSHHHHLIHDQRYLHDRLPSGDLRFHRRT